MGQVGSHSGFQVTKQNRISGKDEFPFPFPFLLPSFPLPFAPVPQLLNPQPYTNPSNSHTFVVKFGGCTGIPFFIAFNIGSLSAKLSGPESCTLANVARDIGSTAFRNLSLLTFAHESSRVSGASRCSTASNASAREETSRMPVERPRPAWGFVTTSPSALSPTNPLLPKLRGREEQATQCSLHHPPAAPSPS